MIRLMPALLGAAVVIAGCASRQPIQGWSPDPRPSGGSAAVGQRYVDFRFVDGQGAERPFHSALADHTVLALTRCHEATHAPTADLLRAIIDANQKLDNVKLVGVDVHWSPGGCQDHDACHVAAAAPDFGTICDPTGAIHRAYGDPAEDWLYVIGPDRTIQLSAPATRGAELGRELAAKVRQLSRERTEAAFQYSHNRR